jgi:trimethylamine---corrinoid protein Co-methyltransferase
MNSGFKSQCVPNYRLLTEDQIKEFHRASLGLLENTGVRVYHDEAVELLRRAGCQVKDDNLVRIPNWLVEDSIRSAPSRITIYNRKGQPAMNLEGRHSHFGLGTDLINTFDVYTQEMRRSVLQDVINAAKVADSRTHIDFVASFALPSDVPTNTMYVECARALMKNSTKPIFFTAAGQEDLAYIVEMASTVVGGDEFLKEKPFLIHYSEPTPPLTHSYGALRKLFLCAEKSIPICYTPADMLGASAPVTLAGSIVQANAEALSGLVIHQLKAKGAPIITGLLAVPLDMRTASFSYGAPDLRLTNSAFADLYHYYGLPMWSTVGSDAQCLDEQASMEHALGTLLAALDGANLIHDVGYLGQGLLGNPASIVMCDEIISYIKRMLRGFEMNKEMLGEDVIQQVGPGGNFLAEKHTLKYFKQELWQPQFISRDNPDTWMKKGSKPYRERVTEAVIDVLETYTPEGIPAGVSNKLDAIVKKAEDTLANTKFPA